MIGHEITHGFDDQGRQYDNVGNLKDWWDLETKNRFIGKTRCIIEQYGNYTASSVNLQLNGINTQGENIADNGGLKEAYRGYSKYLMLKMLNKEFLITPYMSIMYNCNTMTTIFRAVDKKKWK